MFRRSPGSQPALRTALAVAFVAACGYSGSSGLRHLLAVPWAGLAQAAPAEAAPPAPPAPPAAKGSALMAEQCDQLQSTALSKVQPKMTRWEKAASEGRTMHGFGNQASKMLNNTLAKFDKDVTEKFGEGVSACSQERQAIEQVMKQQLYSIFLVQRSTIEQELYQRLKKDLLRRMRRKKRELNVKEKLALLHSSMDTYDSSVRELQPFFVENPERDRAERRLSELQWGITEETEAKEMMQRWKMARMRGMQSRQSKGISVSLSPGMRLMFRPGGFGNWQINSKRQVGPPHNPNEVSMALLNDGDVIDVYNKKQNPPLIKFQPTIGVDLSLG